MGNDKEYSPEDVPIDGEMVGIGPDHQFGIRARLRKIYSDANGGSADAITALLQFAQQVSAEIDIEGETSLDRIALASLKKPLEYLLGDEKAMLAAFGITRDPSRPESERTRQRHLLMAEEMGRRLAHSDTNTEAKRTKAVAKAKADVGEALGAHENTVGAAYKEYSTVAEIAEIMERNCRKS